MRRRKAVALAVPTTAEEAVTLIGAYVLAERIALDARLRAEAAIDRIKGDRDAVIAAIDADQKVRFAQLKAWWEAGGNEAASGRRSAELGGAKIGVRLAPPKVKLVKGLTDKLVVIWLRSLRWSRASDLLRTKVELDKPALIKAHAADEEVRDVLGKKGISVIQTDEFFIDCGLEEGMPADPDVATKAQGNHA